MHDTVVCLVGEHTVNFFTVVRVVYKSFDGITSRKAMHTSAMAKFEEEIAFEGSIACKLTSYCPYAHL